MTTYSFVLSGTQKLTDSCVIIFTFPMSTGISYQAPISCTVGNGFRKTPACTATGGTTSDLVVQASCTSTGTIDLSSPSLYNINVTKSLCIKPFFIDCKHEKFLQCTGCYNYQSLNQDRFDLDRRGIRFYHLHT